MKPWAAVYHGQRWTQGTKLVAEARALIAMGEAQYKVIYFVKT